VPDAPNEERSSTPTVEILLSTWNGEKYLSPLLDSLLAQTAANQLRILVRDDGSTDSTLAILRKYASAHDNIRIIEGTNVGVIRSFGELMEAMNPDSTLAMFCDQDDVWLPNKVSAALTYMSRAASEPEPILYCSRSMVTDEQLNPIRPTIDHHRAPSFQNSMIQNIAPGHTMMANRALVLAARKSYDPEAVIMHDHWWYLVAASLGRVYFDHSWYTLYRSHNNNVIGYSVGLTQRLRGQIEMFLSHDFHIYATQCRVLEKFFSTQLSPQRHECLAGFTNQGNLFSRMRYLSRFGLQHGTKVTSWALSILFLVGRYT